MVLTLHIRFVNMRFCSFILVSALPTVWLAVGCVLLLLTVVMTLLFVLKSREVTTLKKQCEDLRDTMRMMRYEEANLARMLHTASKPDAENSADSTVEDEAVTAMEAVVASGAEAVAEEVVEETIVEDAVVEPFEGPIEEPVEELVEDNVETPTEGSAEPTEDSGDSEEELVEEPMAEPVKDSQDAIAEAPVETLADNRADDMAEEMEEDVTDIVDEEVAEPATEAPVSQKQPINERRPAIPTDLFAMWFAEHEDKQVEPQAESQDSSQEIAGELAEEASAMNALAEEPVAETLAVDELAEHRAHDESVNAATEEQYEEASAPKQQLSKEDERFCRKLERIVNARLRNPNLNIDIIAAQFGVGRTNFYRKVRELTGMSPNDYLRRCRMERAAELLGDSETPINDICTQVGMPDAQYFSRVFKVYYGMSPSAYREHINQ